MARVPHVVADAGAFLSGAALQVRTEGSGMGGGSGPG